MADQGAIGRYKEMPTTAGHTTYPALKHYSIFSGLWQTENITVETYNYSDANRVTRLQFGNRDYPVVNINSREDGIIAGTITENNTPISNVRVILLSRSQQESVIKDVCWTDTNGNYTFVGLDPTKKYSICVIDKSGGTSYNDIIKSNITPFAMGEKTTWYNPDKYANITLSNRKLTATGSVSVSGVANSFVAAASGKKYYEIKILTDSSPGNGLLYVGVANTSSTVPISSYAGSTTNSWGWQANHSTAKRWNNSSSNNYGTTAVVNDVIGILMDITAGTLSFTLNGASQGDAYTGLSTAYSYYPLLSLNAGCSALATFSKIDWDYTPAGYEAW